MSSERNYRLAVRSGIDSEARRRPSPPGRREALAGLLTASLAVGGMLIEGFEWEGTARGPDLLGVCLMALAGGVVVGYGRYPLAVGIVSSSAYTLVAALGYDVWICGLVSAGVVGVAAAHASRRQALVLGLAVTVLAVGLAGIESEGGFAPSELLSSVALALVPVAVGDAFRVRRELAAEAEARADRLERVRELEMARALGVERLRLARDVHDTVGHHLSAIAIQAGFGEQLAKGGDGDGAERALHTIRGLSSTALAETKRLLGLVRGGPDAGAATGLGRLALLAAETERAGLAVTVRRIGAERALPESVDDCAYRVVQEALTNVRRHARAERARVELRYGPSRIELLIEDDGVGATGGPEGLGLTGMRERVAAARGSLSAGPGPNRGWRVHAEIPYGPAPV
jgi:signal transduction histidine kinase